MVTDLGEVKVVELTVTDNLSLIGVLDEAAVDDDVESSSQEISSKVILSNDVYLNKTSYQLSPMRFRVRGYENIYEQRYINGVNFNDQLRGVFNYSSIGALNDMTRNGDVVNYNRPSAFTYGSIGGAENINMRASSISPGTKATLSYANRNYYLRGMVTYSTGLLDNGWAFAASLGGRYSHEGAVLSIVISLMRCRLKSNGKGENTVSLSSLSVLLCSVDSRAPLISRRVNC